MYPDFAKPAKQFEYAEKKQIPFVGLVGTPEIANNTITIKTMATGEKQELSFEALVKLLK